MTGWLMNDKSKGIWKEMASDFSGTISEFCEGAENDYENFSQGRRYSIPDSKWPPPKNWSKLLLIHKLTVSKCME
jgi:hypothetical protein